MITVDIQRDSEKRRYELNFIDRKTRTPVEWSMFMPDEVYNNPRTFSAWMKSLIADIQLKSK